MSQIITAVIIPADQSAPVRIEKIEPNLSVFQELVGGYIERVPGGAVAGTNGQWHAYLDEEGKIKQLPLNVRATVLLHEAQSIHTWDTVNGDLVIVGTNHAGDEADAPEQFTAEDGILETWNRHCDSAA